ncbi:MAG: phosphatase PAP2 family protein [Aquihabitans sp.]
MAWPTWNQAAVAALLAVLLAFVTRHGRGRVALALNPAAREFAGVAGLYSLWRVARVLPLDSPEGAIDRARWIWDFQQRIHLPSELTLQRWVLDHDRIAQLTNWYYGALHVPTLLVFLGWLWVRHRDRYPQWRNGLVFLTAWCLIIRFVRVAPPRFLPDLGFVDLSTRYGFSIYGPVGTGVSDQFAAMPSIHVGWAAVVGFGMLAVSTNPWRWLGIVHLVLTFLVVAATGNHWWLDGIVAIALLGIGLWLDAVVRRRFGEHRSAVADNTAEDDRSDDSVLAPT